MPNENIGTPIPGEVTVETLAREQGWVPEEEYRGDSGRPHISAADFLRKGNEIRGSMKKRVERTDRKVTELNDTIGKLVEHQAKRTKAEIAKARAKWEQEKDDAIDDRDKEGVAAAEKELRQLDADEADLDSAKPTGEGVTPSSDNTDTFNTWHKDNSWYETDQIMTDVGISEAARFSKANADATEGEILAHVESHIKEQFPHKFKDGAFVMDNHIPNNEGGKPKVAPDPVAPAKRSNPARKNGGTAKVSDMNEAQKQVAESFVAAGVKNEDGTPMTVEDYAQQLSDIGEL